MSFRYLILSSKHLPLSATRAGGVGKRAVFGIATIGTTQELIRAIVDFQGGPIRP